MGSTQTNDNPSVKLAMLPWLQGAPADELETIERNTTARLIPPGKDLCRQGERGWDEAFIIIHGEAAVLVDGQAIARLTAGDICGEMALLLDHARSATVIAVTPLNVLVMTRPQFDQILAKAPTVTSTMMTTLASRLDETNHHLAGGDGQPTHSSA
jgi:CRP-like cAMP-binding protein